MVAEEGWLLVEAQHGCDLCATDGAVSTGGADLVGAEVAEEVVATGDESGAHLATAAGVAG